MTTDMGTPSMAGREALLGRRERRDWNPAEQQYSVLVWQRVEELLHGDRNVLFLLSLYPQEPNRLSVMQVPRGVNQSELRLPRVRALLQDTLLFLSTDGEGSAVMQEIQPDGRIVEHQLYPTKYPHIVVDREDVYEPDGTPERTTWCAQRVQNQRDQTQINRWLDLANLGLETLGAAIR